MALTSVPSLKPLKRVWLAVGNNLLDLGLMQQTNLDFGAAYFLDINLQH